MYEFADRLAALMADVSESLKDSNNDVILPLTLPALDIDALITSLADASLSVSGLSYVYVDLRTVQVVAADLRDCFTFYLDATFVQAADISVVVQNFVTLLTSRVSVEVNAYFAGQFELLTVDGYKTSYTCNPRNKNKILQH